MRLLAIFSHRFIIFVPSVRLFAVFSHRLVDFRTSVRIMTLFSHQPQLVYLSFYRHSSLNLTPSISPLARYWLIINKVRFYIPSVLNTTETIFSFIPNHLRIRSKQFAFQHSVICGRIFRPQPSLRKNFDRKSHPNVLVIAHLLRFQIYLFLLSPSTKLTIIIKQFHYSSISKMNKATRNTKL